MVWHMDDLDFHLPSHAQDMLDGLRRLRSQPKLADVTLLVGGRELPCHRGLLALSSPYFHAMFAGDFAESFSARVELRDVEPAAVAQLVDFVYTGRLTITQGNVEALTRTAACLHFPAAQRVCGRYLQQQLDATNCLGICEFGERQGLLGVAAKAWAFLRENFEAVAQEDEFLQLSQERLATCLAGDLLQAQPEQSRLEALLRWVRHDPQARATHLPELLGLVHLDAVPRPRVQQLLATEPLIRESEACREALSQGHERALLGLPREPEEVLVVVGGRALEEEEQEEGAEQPLPRPGNFAFYQPEAKRWMALPDFPDYHKWGFSLAVLNNDVYVTGGSRGTKTDTWSTTQAWCFRLREAAWRPVAPMLKARTNHASAALNGEIYAVGGTTLGAVEVESYDPYTDTWTPISPALKYVSNFSAAGCRGRLYLVGSSACKYNALALQCYNPATDAWSVTSSPFLPKYLSSPRCAALHGALYLVGDNTKKVYVYDPGANLWQKVSQPHLPGRPPPDPRPCREQAWGRWALGVSPPGEVGTVNGDTRAQRPPVDGRAEDPGLLLTEDALSPAHSACPPPQGAKPGSAGAGGYSGTCGLRDSASFLVLAGPEGE
ncbi:kelch-like protein 30 isoform X2 [Physeter macrocephalus]|uniref:Kelch-like protein 30 isoform X2 n=1 Tax=Physeter macrocephalus TaxID=9755 RepID=A0A455AQQ5_PHYMC|nr:kelch-like protein 30 isoform X2 [Physeter catodon]|eukprot:XP_028338897.1 kelch-like protein 30 isoform X2 [Physeter catodon]